MLTGLSSGSTGLPKGATWSSPHKTEPREKLVLGVTQWRRDVGDTECVAPASALPFTSYVTTPCCASESASWDHPSSHP